jgi:signal transduction histidine kinase
MVSQAHSHSDAQNLIRGQYETILEALPCYLTIQDSSLEVAWANKAAREDFGSPNGRKCYEFYRLEKSRCTDCPVRKTFQDRQTYSEQVTLRSRNGSRATYLFHTAAINDEHGAVAFVVQTGVDVSSITDIQKQLILLGETVAGMAHSIKNIMMGLEGGIYVVNKGLEAKNEDEIRDGWEMVLLNFDKISHIVKDILYCSKPRQPNFQAIQPNDTIRQVLELYRETALSYHIEIVLDLKEDLPVALIDPAELHTVLCNLVSNALDACKLDLWKDSHLVEIRSRTGPDGSTVIEVADNGIGIGKDIRQHMFEELFSSKGDQGTGLGLMVTQKIMREHGGSITFRSRPGQGTTFVATFPRRDPPS